MILKLFSATGEILKINTDCIVSLTLWLHEWTKIEYYDNDILQTRLVRESPKEIFRLVENQMDIQEDIPIPEYDKKMGEEFIKYIRECCY